MAAVEKYTFRKFLFFKAIIHGAQKPARAADKYLENHPDVDPDKVATWEQWCEVYPDIRMVETIQPSEAFL